VNREPIVDMEDVSFAYDGHPALENVNLRIGANELLFVVGPNGGGKTTLLRLMLGLLRPTRGRVRVFGRSPGEVRHRIGYVPQRVDLDPQFPVTVMDVALMGRLGKGSGIGWWRRDDRREAARALDEVGLSGLARRPFATLSGGERQRVLIARALAGSPDLLLLDEATAHLDPAVERNLLDLLEGLSERLAIVLVSHDPMFVSELAESVICVDRTVVVHPTDEVSDEDIVKIFGGEMRMVRHGHRRRRKNGS
jgi:zinc transport system ATP-binding protein